jgi:two-component system cell cycle response regulator
MTSDAIPLYRNHVLLLSQSFFIKDNREELLLHAHKYDFDIAFFNEVSHFVSATWMRCTTCSPTCSPAARR